MSCRIKVYYWDTDCGGVVYYSNYLVYFEKARTEWMEKRGVGVGDLSKRGILFIVSKADIDYKSPARYGDILDVKSFPTKIGAARIKFNYKVIRNNGKKLLATGSTDLACISKDLKPQRIPSDVIEKIKSK